VLPRRARGRRRRARSREHPAAGAPFASSSPAAAGGANIAVSGLAAAAASIRHVQARRIDWTLLWVGAASSLPGALLGSRLTGRLSVEMLLRTVGVILLVAGTAAIVQGIV